MGNPIKLIDVTSYFNVLGLFQQNNSISSKIDISSLQLECALTFVYAFGIIICIGTLIAFLLCYIITNDKTVLIFLISNVIGIIYFYVLGNSHLDKVNSAISTIVPTKPCNNGIPTTAPTR
jgi:hypothetical protein